MTDTTVRDMFISALHAYASDGENNAPLSDLYDTISGDSVSFRARPVVGGHLALVRAACFEPRSGVVVLTWSG